MDRNKALALLTTHVPDKHLVSHCIATAAIMKALAPHLSGNPDEWERIGILHDIDYTETGEDMQRHGIVAYDLLVGQGLPEPVARIIRNHNHVLFGGTYVEPVEIALQAADSASGLIIACALVKQGNLSDVSVSTIRKKFKEKSFAAGCDRDRIRLIEKFMSLEEFYGICLNGLLPVKTELGLT